MKEARDYIENNYPILFKGFNLRVEHGVYAINNSPSIQLMMWDEEYATEMPFAKATVYAEGANLEEDEVVIKDYSENEGILALLIKEGIVNKPHATIPLGHAEGHVCQLKEVEE